jgi:hypothetical protein
MAKSWKDGDYVSQSDLDEFVTSGTLVFSTTAQRDALLVGDLAPQPGMFATTTSDGITLRYIVVGGVGYWSPMPGTFLVHATQGTTHTLGASGTATQITNLTTVNGRNYKTWFNTSTSKFQPLCPGFYEIDGTVCFSSNSTGDRRLWLQLNASAMDGTMTVIPTFQTECPVYFLRTCYVYMNGTTDYLMLVASHTASSTLTTATQNYSAGPCSFTARYAGV